MDASAAESAAAALIRLRAALPDREAAEAAFGGIASLAPQDLAKGAIAAGCPLHSHELHGLLDIFADSRTLRIPCESIIDAILAAPVTAKIEPLTDISDDAPMPTAPTTDDAAPVQPLPPLLVDVVAAAAAVGVGDSK